MNRALSMTVVFQGNSLNYGEGIANISELKKIHRGSGDVYTFISRQSLRYDIVRLGNELFSWNLDTVDKTSGVVQFKKDATIKDSVEMDLFGYLKTDKKSKKRPAVARLSHGISLEMYRSDLEFLNNMGLATRINENANLANIEQHESLYSYTITIDLQRLGIDPNDEIELEEQEKVNRVLQLLDILKVLNRNIRGRQENLAPLFVIGGIYSVANPFFLGRVKLDRSQQGMHLATDTIKAVLQQTFAGKQIGDNTHVGLLDGIFSNEEELKANLGIEVGTIEDFFNTMASSVKSVYEVV